jgi:hypothetical protein
LNILYRSHRSNFQSFELEKIDENLKLKSLLYFDDCLGEIKSRIQITKAQSASESSPKSDKVAAGVPNLKKGYELTPLKKPFKKGANKSSTYTHQSSIDRSKKLKGYKSEQAVYDYLDIHKQAYLNLEWVSQDNDGLHYDFRYTTEDKKIKYVEVKSFDKNEFFLSREEYAFGKKHLTEYEIWLVKKNRDIYQILDFFTNAKYRNSETPNEYLIRLRITE